MHMDAYTVMRGEYPIDVERKRHPKIKSLDKYTFTYSNGDQAIFQRSRLISVKSTN